MTALWISLGAVAGANARYWGGLLVTRVLGSALPWGTLVVNVTGCLVLGVLVGVVARRPDTSAAAVLLVGVGFCGSYTTFSAFSAELLGQAQNRALGALVGYAVVSVGLGLAAAALGYVAGSSGIAGRGS